MASKNPNTCENTGTDFEANSTKISDYTGYRTCSACGKNVASKNGKIRWHTTK